MLADMRNSLNDSENGAGIIKNAHAQKAQKKETIFCTTDLKGFYDLGYVYDIFGVNCTSDSGVKFKADNLKGLYKQGWRVAHFAPVAYGELSPDARPGNYTSRFYHYFHYILER